MLLRAVVFILAILAFHPAPAAEKVALLIGNARYSAPATVLKNPPNDVAALKAALEGADFDVTVAENLSRAAMSETLAAFEEKAAGAEVGLVYYSGHGIEVNGDNFLLPVDVRLASDRDVKYEAIVLDDVLATLSRVTKLKLVLLDACRDNPFLTAMKRLSTRGIPTRGLARVDSAESNLLIGYATAPGDVALDGEGDNSPYAQALARHLVAPGHEVMTAMQAVARDVYGATKGKQRPFIAGSLFETVMLGPQAHPSEADPCRDAGIHWSAIGGRKDKALLEEHVRLFGACAFASLARIELAALTPPADLLAREAVPETECDVLAADPDDRLKLASVTGVPFEGIVAPGAIAACESAVKTFPGEARLHHQLARALARSNDFARAMQEFRTAADAGSAAAMTGIAFLHRRGWGVPQDYEKALASFREAAEAGSAAGMREVAVHYFNGFGVEKDEKEALAWLHKAVAAGSPLAMRDIGVFHAQGLAGPKDGKEAVAWFQKAIEAGFPTALYDLAMIYDRGAGVTRDPAKAAGYIEDALRRGLPFPLERLKSHPDEWSAEFRAALQQHLRDAGVYTGPMNGNFTPDTIRAIEAVFGKG